MTNLIREFIKEIPIYNKIFIIICSGYISFLLILSAPAILSNKFEIKQQEYHNVTVSVLGKRMNGKLGKYITTNKLSNKCYNEHCGLPKDGEYFISSINFISIEGNIFIHYFCLKENMECLYNINDTFVEKQKENYIRDAKFTIIGFVVALFVSIFISFIAFIRRKKHLGLNNAM